MLQDLIMVSHAVWKTWPEGLSRQKPSPKAEVFVVIEARSLIDFFHSFIHINVHFSALKWAIFGSLHGS